LSQEEIANSFSNVSCPTSASKGDEIATVRDGQLLHKAVHAYMEGQKTQTYTNCRFDTNQWHEFQGIATLNLHLLQLHQLPYLGRQRREFETRRDP
jgi:hypothetical protein